MHFKENSVSLNDRSCVEEEEEEVFSSSFPEERIDEEEVSLLLFSLSPAISKRERVSGEPVCVVGMGLGSGEFESFTSQSI